MFGQKVRHHGDRVAAVVAETEEIALKALKKIKVEYEVLKPVITLKDAEACTAIVHDSVVEFRTGTPNEWKEKNKTADPRDGKVIYNFPMGGDPRKNLVSHVDGGMGDVEKGFKEADFIVERVFESSQPTQTPLESHVSYAKMDGDRIVIHASTQVPFFLRRKVAQILGIPENKIRVIKERVGGGYGSKQDILLDEMVAFATYKTGRSVFLKYTREEEFKATSSRHQMELVVKAGAKKDGTLTAITMDIKSNEGAYGMHCLTVPKNAPTLSIALYVCHNVSFDIKTFYSNRVLSGAYQGYGAPKGNYALGCVMAELADKTGIDRVEFIEKNCIKEGMDVELMSCLSEGKAGDIPQVLTCGLLDGLKKGASMIEWGKKATSDNPDIKIGKGVCIIQQKSGLPKMDFSGADIKMLYDGNFMLRCGGADIGTGLDTVIVKVAAEILCCDMDNISVLTGDTDNTPYDTGAFASSGTFFAGNATLQAATELKKGILKAASLLLAEPEDELELVYPSTVKGKKSSLSYQDIAMKNQGGIGSGELVGHAVFTTKEYAFPYGANFAQVAVNTRTGEVKVQKFYALQDIGTPINPELALGQIYGGALKAMGHTLWEDLQYDTEGHLLTLDLQSYGAPMIGDLPDDFKVVLIDRDDPHGPFGAKSTSEIAVNGAAPAIANAIHEATGIWMNSWPFTPEKILKALGKI
jgi:putative selenate reductase molybdopterin-binding subunit